MLFWRWNPDRSRTMTRHSVLIALVIFTTIPASRAQDSRPGVLTDLTHAIAAGDAASVLSFAGSRLDIGIFGTRRTYSRSQASFVLKRFFSENPPEAVELERATGTADGWYASVRYRAGRQTKPIRMYMRLRRERGAWRLRELVVREDT